MPRYAVLDEIRRLDPIDDVERIVFLSTCYDFAFDTTRSLELALFRTYGVPSISRLLDHTGEFQHRAQKRYDDTDLIISEILENGYSSDRGQRAIARLNQIHGRFNIDNDDFVYVLSTFIFEPIRWNARFGWRPMCETEKRAYFHFWRRVGKRMNIRDIPGDYDTYETQNRRYESEHYRFRETNLRVGTATRELFAARFPRPLRPVVRRGIHALLDDALIEAFGFPRPSRTMRFAVTAGLRARALLLRFTPPRRRPRLRTQMRHASYPKGYTIETVGPPPSGRC